MQKVKEKSNWKGETIVEIEIERLKAFRNHPFQVRDDDELEKLKESIKMYGILTPLLASKCGIAENAAEKMLSKMCSLEDKLLCACEDSYLPEKYIEQTKQLITTRIAVLKEG